MSMDVSAVVKKLWGKDFGVIPAANNTYLLYTEDTFSKPVPMEGNIETEGNIFKVRFAWTSQAYDFARNLKSRGYSPRITTERTDTWTWEVVEIEVA